MNVHMTLSRARKQAVGRANELTATRTIRLYKLHRRSDKSKTLYPNH